MSTAAASHLSPSASTVPSVPEIVRAQLRSLIPAGEAMQVSSDSLLIDDLGLDSFKFVDLTVRLEDALGLDEFPTQEWVDERVQSGEPLSVGALVQACEAALARQRGETP